MSWYANSLFPVVESVFHGDRPSKLPKVPSEAAEKVLAAGYPKEADYLLKQTRAGLQNVYVGSGLVDPDRVAEDEAWAVADAEWGG